MKEIFGQFAIRYMVLKRVFLELYQDFVFWEQLDKNIALKSIVFHFFWITYAYIIYVMCLDIHQQSVEHVVLQETL